MTRAGGGDEPIMIYAPYVPNGINGFPNLNSASLSEPSHGAAGKAMDIALGLRPQIRHAGKHDSRPGLTSGLTLLFHLMYSKLCTSIGVFGISESMGPRYFARGQRRPAWRHRAVGRAGTRPAARGAVPKRANGTRAVAE